MPNILLFESPHNSRFLGQFVLHHRKKSCCEKPHTQSDLSDSLSLFNNTNLQSDIGTSPLDGPVILSLSQLGPAALLESPGGG